MKNYYSNGKLLITGEYVVLDGTLSLAVPTKFGQSLSIEAIDEPKISWKSFNSDGSIWFEDTFSINEITSGFINPSNDIYGRLIQILNASKTLNPEFLNTNQGYKITTHLTFPKNWGLGTSSTLINNMAQWANVNPFELLKLTFGGSGYDIACAQNNTPISYQLVNEKPNTSIIQFNPSFKNHLYFVYLNKKQNSRDGIAQYRLNKPHELILNAISKISIKIMNAKSLIDFEELITLHEDYISEIIKQKPIKQQLFNDFNGSIKSLGAWGGDFVLATSTENPNAYFKNKGFDVVIPYDDMVLKF
ncbi:GYDIA family GHMP kinase [Mariniflexile jejuense]|uniref:GYDIA family GHMP kinase n=1 Tax=Mariniflexile jejuense TaxID=1173582 RepID=A0ABW3JN89_9FLAO